MDIEKYFYKDETGWHPKFTSDAPIWTEFCESINKINNEIKQLKEELGWEDDGDDEDGI